ncbi:YjgN family protein [Pseudoalteromonas sp. SSDWG2]|uniref:YjgN family protein n=1 Tax=Pseudoalteromonas sp. SSDWG2 TaxID=3139391 RepID=UPI003BAC4FB9
MDLHTPSVESAQPSSFVPYSRRLDFSGRANEFFSIWIVNIVLTLLTLGIYSAWAKVRTKRYFYGHTQLDGHRFDYLANPIQILKGRILAFFFFALYAITGHFNPGLGLLIMFIFAFLMPWVVNQGMRFNMRMSRYRNIRFSFNGTYGEAFVVFILLPVLSPFTLYLLLPYVFKRIDQYLHSNIEYAGEPVSVETKGGEYYLAALMASVASGILFAVFMAIGTSLSSIFGAAFGTHDSSPDAVNVASGIAFFTFMVVYMFVLAVASGIYQTVIRNHLFNSSEIDDIADFKSDLQIVDYTLLLLTNAIAIVCSLGLAYPWAKIRKARMLTQATEVTFLIDPQRLEDQLGEQDSSFAEEAADLFDIDLSLG